MSSNQFVSVRETAQMLGVSEKKVMDLIESRELQAYRIAEKFLRLKKSEVQSLRSKGSVPNEANEIPYSQSERIKDYFYFNDFYIVSCLLIATLLFVIFYT